MFLMNELDQLGESVKIGARRTALNATVVCGSLGKPSRTRVLLDALVARISQEIPIRVQYVELVDIAASLGSSLDKASLSSHARAGVRAIEESEFLIVGAPVFRASIPGLLKHLFDVIDVTALAGKPVLLAATGGSLRHSLVIEHHLRPLFAFFQSLTLPMGVYAGPGEIQDGSLVDAALVQRVELAVSLAMPYLRMESLKKGRSEDIGGNI